MTVVATVCVLCIASALLFWAVCIDGARRERAQQRAFAEWLTADRKETSMPDLEDIGKREVYLQKLVAELQRDLTANERQLGRQRGSMTLLRAELARLERERERLERPDVWPA